MRQLEIVQESGRILAAATDPDAAIPALLRVLHGAGEWDLVRCLLADPETGVLRASPRWVLADERASLLIDLVGTRDADPAQGFTGMACETAETVWVDNVAADMGSLPAGELGLAGFVTAAFVPAIADNRVVGLLDLYKRRRVEREPMAVRLLDALGEQLGLFLARARREDADDRAAGEGGTFAHVSEAILELDGSGTIHRWNARAAELFGWPAAEAVGRSVVDLLIPPADRDARTAWLAGALGDERLAADGRLAELPAVHRTGRPMVVEASVSVREGPAGRLLSVIARDVTEDRAARAGLAQLARFPDENPFPVVRVASDGRLVYVNEPARRLLGSESGQRVPPVLERPFLDVLRTGQPREVETTHGDRTLLLNVVPAGSGGEVNVFGTDVTSRVRAERALRESEAAVTGLYRVAADPSLQLAEQLRRLTDLIVARFGRGSAIISRIIPAGLEVVEANAYDPAITPGFVFTSDRAYSWEALRRDELVAIWDSHVQPEWREHAATSTYGLRAYVGSPIHVAGRLYGAVSWSSPFPRNRPYRPAELDYVRLVAEWIGTAIERDEATREIADANRGLEAAAQRAVALATAAEAASRAKGLFLATMSHEIRTPLHGLLGMVQVLEGMPLEAGQVRAMDLIRGSGDQLMAIIDDVLDLANLDSGQLELRDRPFLPSRVVADAVAPFEVAAHGKGLDLSVSVDPAAEVALLGDPVRLRQVLGKLVANALKFTPRGFVRVAVAVDARRPEAPSLRFTVADSGIGIDPAEHERIFQPFTQVDAGMDRLHQGSGLGLAIAARLVAMMGGSIDLDSAPGAGSTFTLRVPLRPAPAEVPAAEAEPASAGGPRRILVVEDTPVSREIAVRFLEREGHDVLSAADGREALGILAREEVDIVLMDCQMPGVDGFEATRILRARELEARLPHLPVVAVTANTFADDRARAFAVGMDAFLPKPYRASDLLAMVQEHAADPGLRSVRPVPAGGDPATRPAEDPHLSLAARAAASAAATPAPAGSTSSMAAVQLPTGLAELAAIGIAPSTLAGILQAFLADGDALVADMREALDGWNRQAAQEAARSLAEPAATIGLDELVTACRALAAAAEPDLRPRAALVEGRYREAAQRVRAIAASLPTA